MSRTPGAVDIHKRKIRKDKILRRKRNRMGNLVPYIPKRKRTDGIKIWFWHVKRMSKDGYKNWSVNVRGKIRPVVFYPISSPIIVEPKYISNIEAIEQLALDTIGYEGNFQLRMPSHSKNRFHVSFRKKANIVITETEEGLRAKASNFGSLKRYWFFRNSI